MMKKMALPTAALLAALFWTVPAFPGTIPASIVPVDARWIVHLDVEKFFATQLYSLLEEKGKFDIKTRDLERWFKVDPRKDLSGVTVFGLGPGDSQIVFAVAGKFDKAAILDMIDRHRELAETPYGSYTIYSGERDGCGTFINDNLIVFAGSRGAIEKVLDTAGGKAKTFAATALSASLKEVPAGAFFSGVLPDLSEFGREIGSSKVLEKASGLFFLAQEKSENLLVRLQVTANSLESAKDMADVVQGLIAMGRLGADREETARLGTLLEGLQVKQDGKVLRLDFERPSREIADLLSERHGFRHLFN
jgi:hypothetical protein